MNHINQNQIDIIIRLEQGGLSQRAISRMTGHSRMTVRRLITIGVILLVGTLIHYIINT